MGSDMKVEYGRRLLPTIIDEIAALDPNREIYSIPIGSTAAEGFKSVNMRDFANAISRASNLIDGMLGRSTSFETLGYIGPSKYI